MNFGSGTQHRTARATGHDLFAIAVIYFSLFFYFFRKVPGWNSLGPLFVVVAFVVLLGFLSARLGFHYWMLALLGLTIMALKFVYEYYGGGLLQLLRVFQQLRFYFGTVLFFYFFVFYYQVSRIRISQFIRTIFVIVSCEALIEFVLINTVISSQMLPNAPPLEGAESYYGVLKTVLFGGVSRYFGVGGNPSITPSLIIFLACIDRGMRWQNKITWVDLLIYLLAFMSVVVSGSGSGYVALILTGMVWLICMRPFYLIVTLFAITAICGLLVFIDIGGFSSIFRVDDFMAKISPFYIALLIDRMYMGMGLFFDHVLSDKLVLIFGNVALLEADQAFIGFVSSQGLLLVFYYLGFLGWACTKYIPATVHHFYFRLAILALVIGTNHYPVLFTVPAHMLLGGLMAEGSLDRASKKGVNAALALPAGGEGVSL